VRLLMFNLAVDEEDSNLGFAVAWIKVLAQKVDWIDLITMRTGVYRLPGNVRVYSVGKELGFSRLTRFVRFYRQLFKLLRTNQYDGCFAHMMPLFAVLAGPLLRAKKIPLVLWFTHKSVRPILHVALFCSNKVVSASKGSFRIPSSKVIPIGHGIDSDQFTFRESNETGARLVTTGRISRVKRLDRIIEILAKTREDIPEVTLSVIGEPVTKEDFNYLQELRELIQQKDLEEIVTFHGAVTHKELPNLLGKFDCYISMSETGSIDKGVLEAMSCGLLVLAPRIYLDVFGSELGHRYCVLENGNDEAQLKLRNLLTLSFEERALSRQELRKIVVEGHNLDRIVDRVLEQFSSLRG